MQKIIPNLWFNDNVEEAVNFYMAIFENSEILNITRYGEAAAHVSGRPKGTVMTITFKLEGQVFTALNGGPHFTFSPAISFLVNCQTQEEIDALWEKLSEGGAKEQCGWLKDKYGVSWQIVPSFLDEVMQNRDQQKTEKVMTALLQMHKLEIEPLKRAYSG